LGDLAKGAERLPVVGAQFGTARRKLGDRSWERWVSSLIAELGDAVRPGSHVTFIDEQSVDRNRLRSWVIREFPGFDGPWDGLPLSDQVALQELRRHVSGGVRFLVFTEPTFWWFDHYVAFTSELVDRFALVVATPRLRVYDLGG
jgi:hypothetical protein